MDEATGADTEFRDRTAAPAELRAARDDISQVRPWREREHKSGDDEEPEIVDAQHLNGSRAKRRGGTPQQRIYTG